MTRLKPCCVAVLSQLACVGLLLVGSSGTPLHAQARDDLTIVELVQGQPFPVGGDIVTAADGRPVARLIDLQQVVLEREAGETVNLTVWREGSEQQVEVTLEVVPTE